MNAQLPTVRRQHAALRVNTAGRSFTGWTELFVSPPAATASGAAATLGLHCFHGLDVRAVHVNGAPVQFELHQPIREELPESVTGAAHDAAQRRAAAVADYCFYLYERQLQRERQPELVFRLPDPLPPAPAAGGSAGTAGTAGGTAGGGAAPVSSPADRGKQAGKPGKELVCIRVEFGSKEGGCSGGCAGGVGGTAGLRFWRDYAATDNQVRRASAWLPCVDAPSASTLFTLNLTCRAQQVAVGPGQLRQQSWADGGREWRTFRFEVPLPCAPCQLGLAVGPFQAWATAHTPRAAPAGAPAAAAGTAAAAPAQPAAPVQLTHFAPQRLPAELSVSAVLAAPPSVGAEASKGSGSNGAAANGAVGLKGAGSPADRSSHFFGLVLSFYEQLLGVRWPLPAVQQVFLPLELALSDSQAMAGLQLLNTSHLIQPRAIEQSIAARCAIARCLARQWFGVLLRAATPLDEWLVEGLSGWMEEQFVRKFMGRNELAYRRWRDRQAIFLADNGEAPPLAATGVPSPSPWGPLYGTERLEPSRLWSTKATAVVAMLETRAGEDLFRKHVGTVVAAGLTALAAEQQAAGVGGGGAAAAAAGAGDAASPGAAPGSAGAASGPAGATPPKAGAAGAAAGAGDGAAGQQPPAGAGAAAGAGQADAKATRLLDTMTFLNDLGRAGSFRKEMAPFAMRWVYGRGVPHITGAYLWHARNLALELALKQTGSESAKRAADLAMRQAVTEGSNAGIVKAVVREAEGDQYVDHPVHLGGEAFVLAELKVNPVVEKKQPGRRSKKRKAEEDEAAEAETKADVEFPVRWARLDPAGELLCDIRLMQPERQLSLQLLHSRDVVAQAEAIQRLGELRVASGGVRAKLGLNALTATLRDRSVFYRVRGDAALALAGLRDEQGAAAGLPILLDFYKGCYFHQDSDTPKTVAIADASEYFVAQAVATAVSLCREPDGTSPVDAVFFLVTCLQDYASASGTPFSDYGLVAALCAALGNLRMAGFGETLLTLLERFLERDTVLVSPGSAIGRSCLLAMAALCASGTCDEEEAARVATAARLVRKSHALPVPLRHAALAAALQLAAAQRGPAAALQLAVAGATGGAAADLPAAASPAFLLEEAGAVVTAANSEAAVLASAAAAVLGQEQIVGTEAAPAAGVHAPMPLLQQLAGLLSEGGNCRLRHLAFVLLQLLAVQPPTLYRPPPNEAEDVAAFIAAAGIGAAAAAPAPSVGATHRTGAGQASHGTAAAAAGAAGAAAPKIRLQLPGVAAAPAAVAAVAAAPSRGMGTRSMARSGGFSGDVAISEDGPAMSDARMGDAGAALAGVDQPLTAAGASQGPPVFSPVRHAAAPAFGAAEAAGPAVGADIMAAFGAAPAAPAAAPPAGKVRLRVGGVPAAGGEAPAQQQQQYRPSPSPPPGLPGVPAAGAAPAAWQPADAWGQQQAAAAAWPPAVKPPPMPLPAAAAQPAPAAAPGGAPKPAIKLKLKVKLPNAPPR